MYYKKQAISRELYEWCLEQGYADANLIAKWKKVQYFPSLAVVLMSSMLSSSSSLLKTLERE